MELDTASSFNNCLQDYQNLTTVRSDNIISYLYMYLTSCIPFDKSNISPLFLLDTHTHWFLSSNSLGFKNSWLLFGSRILSIDNIFLELKRLDAFWMAYDFRVLHFDELKTEDNHRRTESKFYKNHESHQYKVMALDKGRVQVFCIR